MPTPPVTDAVGELLARPNLQGRVAEWVDDPDLKGIDRLARHYTGNPYPVRDRKRVNAWIEIDRWHGWGSAQATDRPQSSSNQHLR